MDNREKHFTASALVIHDNKVLLVNHLKLGVWLYPGGHIENNETPDQTIGDHYHNDLIYLCRVTGGDAEKLVYRPNESSGIGFFSKEELEKIKLFPNFRRLLEKTFDNAV